MTEENKEEPFELRLRKGTVFYEKKQLEDRLKQINELNKQIGIDHGYGGDCENLCVFCDDLSNQIERLSNV